MGFVGRGQRSLHAKSESEKKNRTASGRKKDTVVTNDRMLRIHRQGLSRLSNDCFHPAEPDGLFRRQPTQSGHS